MTSIGEESSRTFFIPFISPIPTSPFPLHEERCSNKSLAYYSTLWQTNATGRNGGRQSWRGTHCAGRHFPECREVGQAIPRSGLPASGGLIRRRVKVGRDRQLVSRPSSRTLIG